jgi:hypothetical protein
MAIGSAEKDLTMTLRAWSSREALCEWLNECGRGWIRTEK